jgi:acetolactate synthase-1/2/3 large subunit
MNGIEYIAKILKSEGVEWITCFPNHPLIEAAAKEGIRPITFRHERGAVMAADGFSRVSGPNTFGVVMMQSQAGAENSVGGLAQANADNIPILVLPGGNPIDRLHISPNFSAVKTWETVVKTAEFVTKPEATGSVMRRAFHNLRNGRPGPVAVELPADIMSQEISEADMNYTSPGLVRSMPSASDIKDVVAKLVAAKNPLLWAGQGVMRADATAELQELAELLDIPVFTTMPGKSAFNETHPLSVGAGGQTATSPARQWIDECDVLFAIGASLTASGYAQKIPDGKFVIHSVLNSEEINGDTPVSIGLAGDAKLTLAAVIDEAKAVVGEGGRTTGVQARVAAARKEWQDAWMPYLTSDTAPLSPYRVIHELNQNLNHDNSSVTHDAGAPRDQIVPFYTATNPHSYIGWGKTTHLGFSIPLMIGAKLAMPERFCLNMMGDGAWGMSGTDLETSSRAGIPITTVLLNNGIMATYPGGFPTAQERYGASHMQGDYAAIAQGMGAEGLRVSTPAEMGPALKKAQELNSDGKTVLIDVKTRNEDSRSPGRFA